MTGALMTVGLPWLKFCPFSVNSFAVIGTEFEVRNNFLTLLKRFSSTFLGKTANVIVYLTRKHPIKCFLSLNKHILKQKENNTSDT